MEGFQDVTQRESQNLKLQREKDFQLKEFKNFHVIRTQRESITKEKQLTPRRKKHHEDSQG
jgi:hypothetical protein